MGYQPNELRFRIHEMRQPILYELVDGGWRATYVTPLGRCVAIGETLNAVHDALEELIRLQETEECQDTEAVEMLRADDGNPATMAAMHEIHLSWDDPHDLPDAGRRSYPSLFPIAQAAYRFRGGKDINLPGRSTVSGDGRADGQFAADAAGELYIFTKTDGMIRTVVGPAKGSALEILAERRLVGDVSLARSARLDRYADTERAQNSRFGPHNGLLIDRAQRMAWRLV